MPTYSLIPSTPKAPEIRDVYEFVIGNKENNRNNFKIPDFDKRLDDGYQLANVGLIIDHNNKDSWLVPAAYIGSNHSSLGVRFTINRFGKVGTWEVGQDARNKKARLMVTWFQKSEFK